MSSVQREASKDVPTASERPWRHDRAHPDEDCANIGYIDAAEWDGVAVCYSENGRENAALIVRCVNAHDDLVAALRGILAALQADAPGTPLNNHKYDVLGAQARAALAKAEAK